MRTPGGPTRWLLPVAALATLAAAPAAGQGATLSPGVAARLATATGDARVPVLVTLRSQVHADRYAGRPAALLRALRGAAGRTQAPLVASLRTPVRRFWLVNALSLDATPRQVRRLARLGAVARVDLDGRALAVRDAPAPPAGPGAGSWGIAAIGAPQVWSRYGLTGAGVRIGTIDTGVDPTSPDLAGKVVAWRDFVSGRTTPYDDNGHGTHTTGTMVGGSADGGPIGVAPDARVLAAKAFAGNGTATSSNLLAAGQWLSDPDGNPATPDQPAVINNSWGGSVANDPWFRQMVRRWVALGIAPVFAAGNAGPAAGSVASPADYPESIAVGAVDQSGALASFSSVGPGLWTDPDHTGPPAGTVLVKPNLVAPGASIVSLVGTSYQAWSGTSMAAPHVTGVIALMHQANPALSVAQEASLLQGSARDILAPGADPGTGYGMVDAPAAVAAALGTPAATTPFSAPAAPAAAAPARLRSPPSRRRRRRST